MLVRFKLQQFAISIVVLLSTQFLDYARADGGTSLSLDCKAKNRSGIEFKKHIDISPNSVAVKDGDNHTRIYDGSISHGFKTFYRLTEHEIVFGSIAVDTSGIPSFAKMSMKSMR